jgi:hypothetical protein
MLSQVAGGSFDDDRLWPSVRTLTLVKPQLQLRRCRA